MTEDELAVSLANLVGSMAKMHYSQSTIEQVGLILAVTKRNVYDEAIKHIQEMLDKEPNERDFWSEISVYCDEIIIGSENRPKRKIL